MFPGVLISSLGFNLHKVNEKGVKYLWVMGKICPVPYRFKINKIFPYLAEQIINDYEIEEGICLDIGAGPGSLGLEMAKKLIEVIEN